MTQSCKVGDRYTFTLTTTPEMSARRYQDSSPDVFATPHLVGAVEAAAARLMEPCLEEGEMTVGASVELQHSAPTPLGWEVRAEATLVEMKGRKFVFEVICSDAAGPIGRARHTRFVVDRAAFQAGLEQRTAADGA